MNRCHLALCVAVAITGCQRPNGAVSIAAGKPSTTRPADAVVATKPAPPQFSVDAYMDHVRYLAGDKLAGRGIGTDGIRLAEEYIVERFQQAGLRPAGDEGHWFQMFRMHAGATRTPEGRLAVHGVDSTPEPDRDYVPFAFSSSDPFAGDVIFCGYGISNPQKQHDDYLGTDVTGKVVLVFRGEPPDWKPEDGHYTEFADFQRKVNAAKHRGAAAILMVNPAPTEAATDELTPFSPGPNTANYGLPAFHVSRRLAEGMVTAGGAETLDSLQKKVDAGQFATLSLAGVHVEGVPGVQWKSSEVSNIIGILRGTGPHAEEYVVVGGHHDHLGVCIPGRRYSLGPRDGTPQIHNGADDNASGTAGVLELAAALAAGPRLDRSVVFMTFTAEESGLIGSEYYVAHPVVPLAKAVAMVNLDMIGRLPSPEAPVQVFGTQSADELGAILDESVRRTGITVVPHGDAVGGSDQTPFYAKGIPVLHFYTGVNPDYHTPNDDTDRINGPGAVRILKLACDVVTRLARNGAVLTYNGAGTARLGMRSGYKVVMGVLPDYVDDGRPGLSLVSVSEGGPAETAGMEHSDRLLTIQGRPIDNVEDFMNVLSGGRPGDEITVVVKRGDTELTLKVVLAAGR